MKDLIKEAAEAKKQIADKERVMKAELLSLEKQRSKISDFYWKAIRKLEDEQYEKVSAIKRQEKEIRENQFSFIELTEKPINKLKTVLSLIECSKSEKEDLSLKPQGIVQEVDVLVDNQYLNLRVYISTNNKPKNKYTLCIVGESIFYGVIKYPFDYNNRLIFDNHPYCHSPSILIMLKDAPTVEELVAWYEKNKTLQFWNEQEHNEIVNLYEWTLENCNTYEWQLEYLLDRKDYWENRHSNGTETPEYKDVLKAIKRLKTKEPA